MTTVDKEWDSMLEIAKIYQQEYYELLPEWTKYKREEYEYLKKNIGFALFGPPSENEDVNQEKNFIVDNADLSPNNINVVDAFHYKPSAEELINKIYNNVCTYGEGYVDEKSIYFGIIFNVTFRTKNESTVISSSENKNEDEEHKINIQPMPIFKIKRSVQEAWYIDITGRVYETWTNYKENNTLPTCTMVLPNDGFYQPDTAYEITEEFSTVWLEIVDSPACSTVSKVLKCVDTGSTVIGFAGVGACIASVFIPFGPLALGATVALTGANGLWTFGRSVQNLVDKGVHKESFTDTSAACAWLGVTGSAFGLLTTGGTALLRSAVQSGQHIGTTAKVIYNSLLIGNIGVNGFGIGFQGYCMYRKYQEGNEIHIIDVLSLGTHVLFFANTVLNLQFAGELIESTQGKILDDYRSHIRSKRLRKAFNRTKRAAAQNNMDEASANAEVIRYINKKRDLQFNINNSKIPTRNFMSFDNGKIKFNGIVLLDPMKFVIMLLHSDQHNVGRCKENTSSSTDEVTYKLRHLLLTLLHKFYSETDNRNTCEHNIDEFNSIFEDIKSANDATHIFELVFEMAVILLIKSKSGSEYLNKAVHFLWSYIKENLKRICLNVSSSIDNKKTQKMLREIITTLFEYIDAVMKELLPAFTKYIVEYSKFIAYFQKNTNLSSK